MSIPRPLEEQHPALARQVGLALRSDTLNSRQLSELLNALPTNLTVERRSGTCKGHRDGDYELRGDYGLHTHEKLREFLQEKCRERERKTSVRTADYTIRKDMKEPSPVIILLHLFTFGALTVAQPLPEFSAEGYVDYYHYDWADDCSHISSRSETVCLQQLRSEVEAKLKVVEQQGARQRAEARRQAEEQQARQRELERSRREEEERDRRDFAATLRRNAQTVTAGDESQNAAKALHDRRRVRQ